MKLTTRSLTSAALAMLALSSLTGCPVASDPVDNPKLTLPGQTYGNAIGNEGFVGWNGGGESSAKKDSPKDLLQASPKYHEIKNHKEADLAQAKIDKLTKAAEERRKAEEARKKEEEEARKKAEEEAKKKKNQNTPPNNGEYSPAIYAKDHYPKIKFVDLVDDKGTVRMPNATLNVLRNFQDKTLKLVNKRRGEAHVADLTLHDSLNAYAMVRSRELMDKMASVRPNGDQSTKYCGASCVEIISENGKGTPESFVELWMGNNDTKEAILKDTHTRMGVGISVKDGNHFYVSQLLGDDSTETKFKLEGE